MKQRLAILLFIISNTILLAQKKEIFVTDDFISITETEYFAVSKDPSIISMRFETDTLAVNMVAKRVKKGTISKQSLDSIRNDLSKLSGKEISKENIIVVNYHHGKDKCNSGGSGRVKSLYETYLKNIEKLSGVSQFFMYKSSEGKKKYGKKLRWIHDKNSMIESSFFPVNYPCGSFVLIDEKGNYYVRKGEYILSKIIDLLNNKQITFKGVND